MEGEVKSMRALVLAIGALVVVAGCGRVPGVQVTAGDYKLYEAASTSTSNNLSVIDSRSHSVELNMPLGTPSPDWTHLYTVQGTVVVDLDPRTGAVLHKLQLPGSYQLPSATSSGVPGGLSPNGHWLVLESFDQTPTSLPGASHLLVLDTTYATKPKRIDLNGYFTFDAVNNGGDRVYLIEYLSNTGYQVRFYNLGASSGYLDPTVVFDKSDGSSAMAGIRLSGVPSHDQHWLYSVYVRPDRSAFIHALNLEGPIAFCIDLPGSGYATNPDEFHWSLAMSADGLLPQFASRVNSGGTPHLALAASALATIALVLTGSFQTVLALSAFFYVVQYATTFTSLFVLRRTEPDAPRAYRAWGYPWIPGLVLIGALAFIVGNLVGDRQNSVRALIVIAASYPLYLGAKRALGS